LSSWAIFSAVIIHDALLTFVYALLAPVWLLLVFWFEPQRNWNRGIGAKEARTIVINGEEVIRRSQSLTVRREWSEFARWRQTKHFIILLPKERVLTFSILRRAISLEDGEKIYALLETRLPTEKTGQSGA
jgi:hypothetical protein